MTQEQFAAFHLPPKNQHQQNEMVSPSKLTSRVLVDLHGGLLVAAGGDRSGGRRRGATRRR